MLGSVLYSGLPPAILRELPGISRVIVREEIGSALEISIEQARMRIAWTLLGRRKLVGVDDADVAVDCEEKTLPVR